MLSVVLGSPPMFDSLKRQCSTIERFRDPSSLLSWLHVPGVELDAKDAMYAELVMAARVSGPTQSLATSLVFVGLWCGLDHVRRKIRWLFESEEECAGAMVGAVSGQILTLDLERVHRVASTLVMNAARSASSLLIRQHQHERACHDPEKHIQAAEEESPAIELEESRTAFWRRIEVAAGRSGIEVLRLTAELDCSLAEYARRLGKHHGRLRQQVSRAKRRVRKECPDIVSHFQEL